MSFVYYNVIGNFYRQQMNDFPKEEFLRDLSIKTLVQHAQFEQWLKSLFYLNNELIKSWEFVYQEMFYLKFYETITEGLVYANKVLEHLKIGNSENKIEWYNELINGINNIKAELSEEELDYIEYRRHNTCHIFQNSYEHIQDNFKIKKNRKDKELHNTNNNLKKIINKYGSDKKIDFFLNSKLQSKLHSLHNRLTKIYDKKP